MPSDPIEMLLQSILQQSRETTHKLDSVVGTMVVKSDFERFQDSLEKKLMDIEDQFEEVDAKFKIKDNQNTEQNLEIKASTEFIKRVNEGVVWFIRVTVVAGLGVMGSILPGYLNGSHYAQAQSSAIVQSVVPNVQISTPPTHHP